MKSKLGIFEKMFCMCAWNYSILIAVAYNIIAVNSFESLRVW